MVIGKTNQQMRQTALTAGFYHGFFIVFYVKTLFHSVILIYLHYKYGEKQTIPIP